MATATVTFYPSAIGSTSISGSVTNPSNPVGKDSSNTTYSQWSMKTGSNAESYVFYSFDCSSIPEGATITSVTCSAKAYVSSTSRVTSRAMQMYTGSTAKGSAQTNITSTASALTITCGSWTRAELQNAKIRIYGKRGTSGTSYSATMRFYGASLTVTYEYSTKGIYVKKNGAWQEYKKAFKKISGAWAEQTIDENLIDDTKALIYAGEYIPPWTDIYQKVEYIENTGSSYIDTGVSGGNASFAIDVQATQLVSWQKYFGGLYTEFVIYEHTTYGMVLSHNPTGSDEYQARNSLSALTRTLLEFDYQVNRTYANGVEVPEVRVETGVETVFPSPLAWGASNVLVFTCAAESTNFAKMKLYHLTIGQDGVTTRDFYPCYRKADGEIGLYDTINNVFYPNAGSGTFTKGADVN